MIQRFEHMVGRFAVVTRLLVLALAMLLFVPAAQAQVQTRYTNTTDSTTGGISSGATPCNARFTRTFVVGTNYTVGDVDIGVLMAHGGRGDLNMYLVSPSGTRVQFFNRIGGSTNNFNALLDDEAATGVASYTGASTASSTTTVPPYNASYSPSSALSGFDGQSTQGTWTLEICDAASGDSGTFFQADLYLTSQPPHADLSLSKTVNNATPVYGAAISYTLTVTNASSSSLTATGITVRDVLPAGVTYTGYSGSGSYVPSTGLWTVDSLAPGQSASLILSVTVSATSGAAITNVAEITASSATDIDSTPDNGITSEDDYATRSFTVSGTRVAGTPPSFSCPVGSTIFDWDTRSWTVGSTSNSYTVSGVGTLSFGIVNPGTWLSSGTYGGLSPLRQNVLTGGLTPSQYSLFLRTDQGNVNDVITTTITVSNAVQGARFTIFDVDFGSNSFADKVTVTGSYGGATVIPTLTNGLNNYVIGNSAYGDISSSDGMPNGNVVVTFSSPIDQITISYGNHSLAPNNPGTQHIALHDFTLCNPATQLSASKVNTLISDPVNLTTAPKAIPGALIEYCISITNPSTAVATDIVMTDAIPANMTYVAGSIRSGSTCSTATALEDDDATGADESNPYGASVSGSTITANAASLAASSSFAIKLQTTVN